MKVTYLTNPTINRIRKLKNPSNLPDGFYGANFMESYERPIGSIRNWGRW
jgi:hypothetical protein